MKKLAILALALSATTTAMPAYAADADIGGLVALSVCDTLGVSGLTIASDDTCLSISGEVEYEFEYEIDGATGDHDTSSEVDWELVFEAFTATDLGTSRAVLALVPVDPADPASPVEISEAFVSFGNTTLLTVGYTETIFEVAEDQLILDDLDFDDIDDSHVIQVVSVLDNGTYFALALEDLNNDGALGAFVGYEDDTLTANLGGFIYNLYDVLDSGAAAQWNIYGDALAEFDDTEFFAAFVAAHDRFDTVTSVGVDLDDVFLKAALGTHYDVATTAWAHTLGLGFTLDFDPVELDFEIATTDFTDLAVEMTLELNEDMEIELGASVDDINAHSDAEAELTLTVALGEALEVEAWTAVEYYAGPGTTIYGVGGGVAYEPGGDFEISAGLESWSNGDMVAEFGAAKAF
ncbi:hypothetical protein [Pelagibacterium sp.]|uniref:hypothetical protein n=1 Tax=Pelagibacterium sp. TaxID=1967288 RepID=UPI003BAAB691